jgi:ubiquitin carboxyl-terminal hydrolase 4/11/15
MFVDQSNNPNPSLQSPILCVVKNCMYSPSTTSISSLPLSSLLTFHRRNNRKRKFQSHRPKWVDPNVYLDPGFQNLFELSYFTSARELVPVGWGSVDEDKDYPRLSSRDPQVLHSMQEDDQAQDDYAMPNGRTQSEASSDIEDDAPQLVAPPTRMNEESSDEDEPAAPAPSISRVSILLAS